MKTEVGVWIDHKKAVIAMIAGGKESMRQVTSNMEGRVRFSGGAQQEGAENQRDRRFDGHLDEYYDEVIGLIRDAQSILILGPGEAKGELKARLVKQAHQGRIVAVEPTDKMTDRQISVRVRQQFLEEPPD